MAAKYGKYTGNQIEALLNMAAGGDESNLDRLLRGELRCTLEVVKMILAIDRSKTFNPAAFIGAGWTIWRGPATGNGLEGDEQQDTRSLALKEIDFVKAARFETGLDKDQSVITGEKRLDWLCQREKDFIRADARFGQDLCEEPGQKTLEWFYKTFGVTWFELPGTVLRDSDGLRCFLCLCRRGDGQWDRDYCDWLGLDRRATPPALVFASST